MAVDLIIPALGESISEATIAKWLKQVGDAVGADEPIAQLETDKVTVDLPAPQAGVLLEQRHPAGATVRVGDSIGIIDPRAAKPAEAPAPAAALAPEERRLGTEAPLGPPGPAGPTAPGGAGVGPAAVEPAARAAPAPVPPLSPTIRRLLREQGIDPQTASRNAAARLAARPDTAQRASTAASGAEEIVPMSPLRRRIAERLVEAQHTAAILTTFNEVDMSAIQALRTRHQEEFVKRHGVKLGFMSFFVRGCVESLRAFPGLNAEVRGTDIVYKKHYDIGVAVGGGKGLVVPVLRGADRMGLGEIERAIAGFAQKAKDNKLTLEDLSGGTFTISNGGVYGSMMSTPLLNMPQTGILGMHNIIRRPVAVGEQIEIRPMMYLALSYDHRVVDGREAVQFLVQLKGRLEQPEKLLLDL